MGQTPTRSSSGSREVPGLGALSAEARISLARRRAEAGSEIRSEASRLRKEAQTKHNEDLRRIERDCKEEIGRATAKAKIAADAIRAKANFEHQTKLRRIGVAVSEEAQRLQNNIRLARNAQAANEARQAWIEFNSQIGRTLWQRKLREEIDAEHKSSIVHANVTFQGDVDLARQQAKFTASREREETARQLRETLKAIDAETQASVKTKNDNIQREYIEQNSPAARAKVANDRNLVVLFTNALRTADLDDDSCARLANELVANGINSVAMLQGLDATHLEKCGFTLGELAQWNLGKEMLLSSQSGSQQIQRFDAFLSHNWGAQPEYAVHAAVSEINRELQSLGVHTWFDDNNMGRQIAKAMSNGIDRSATVIVFITAEYIKKANGEGEHADKDNCFREFNYANMRKPLDAIIPVVLEDSVRDQRTWSGALGIYFAAQQYIDLSPSVRGEARKKNIDKLRQAIAKQVSSAAGLGLPSGTKSDRSMPSTHSTESPFAVADDWEKTPSRVVKLTYAPVPVFGLAPAPLSSHTAGTPVISAFAHASAPDNDNAAVFIPVPSYAAPRPMPTYASTGYVQPMKKFSPGPVYIKKMPPPPTPLPQEMQTLIVAMSQFGIQTPDARRMAETMVKCGLSAGKLDTVSADDLRAAGLDSDQVRHFLRARAIAKNDPPL